MTSFRKSKIRRNSEGTGAQKQRSRRNKYGVR